MGYGFKLRCKACDYEEDFFLGTGMMYNPLVKIIDETIKDKKARREIKDILENHKIEDHSFGYEIFRCEDCFRLYRKFNVEITYDEGKIYKYNHKCTKCKSTKDKSTLKVLNDSKLENEICPNCHKDALTQEEWILWD